ncbi:AP-1 complex subunit mu-1 [Saguinus oedipus]|uniref:AP-1 complex subunit mu-1 n=1 Tax=Saguinus oedipus TaxID=9490 RepID=A0ABQ9TT56_SAGOE|nr:AP-1 complex subunit mu-1 [Saguinus oedipus]
MLLNHGCHAVVATSKKNACVSLVFSFLYKVVQVFSEYFKELEEESIRDNFVIIYELLDELMDFGYPQTTDSKILQEYITQEGHKLETGAPRPPATVTNAVSWRSEGIKYRKNEVFLDVIEGSGASRPTSPAICFCVHTGLIPAVWWTVMGSADPGVRIDYLGGACYLHSQALSKHPFSIRPGKGTCSGQPVTPQLRRS